MRIYLVRHGQTIWNSELRYQGQTDVPLSDMGLEQSHLVAVAIRDSLAYDAEASRDAGRSIEGAVGGHGALRLYSSDLVRAVQTAESVGQAIAVPVEPMPGLREASFGEWEGLSFDVIAERYPELWEMWRVDPGQVDIPGAESRQDFRARILRAFDEIVGERNEDATAVVVTHGGVIKTFIAEALGMSYDGYWKVRSDNCGISVVDAYPEGFILTLMNETRHLLSQGHGEKTNRLL